MARVQSRAFSKLRKQFFEAGKRDQEPCWLCGMSIDYDAAPGTTPDSHELDHYHPVSLSPELQEDPANFRHAHRSCNGARGNRSPSAGLGQLAPSWWK